ncbi:MAG: 8-amino-7-oxononanoate synthase [Polyangiaceae bacterium]
MNVVDEYIAGQVARLGELGQWRDPQDAFARSALAARFGEAALDATSNDYLGLAPGLPVHAASVSRETARAGAGASRLVQGTWPEHVALERELSDWVDRPAALLFSSGFAANCGSVAALGGPDTAVFSDQFNHASIVDGCRLSRAQVTVVPHLSIDALSAALEGAHDRAMRWVVTESYFSMDGDGPDLGALRELCDRHHAGLVVDEAHAIGVFGPGGSGLCREQGIAPDVLVGTLGKAVGTEAAFVAGSEALRGFLWNRARSFVFSTAPSPATCALTLRHVQHARAAETERARLRSNVAALRDLLSGAGLPLVAGSFGPIVSLLIGENQAALAFAEALREAGVLVQAIRPPTVPQGFARIRLTVTARHTPMQIERLGRTLIEAWRRLRAT